VRTLGETIKSIDVLVLVRSAHCGASTSSLSTTWSTWSLIGRPHLEVGFSLRCFQRLSVPYMATGLCSWQNNPHTRGTSIQVLSYYG